MSVLMEFSMFPTDKGVSVSEYVSKVIEIIRESTDNYKLTAMGTIIETETFDESLAILKKSYDVLNPLSERIFSTVKFDARKSQSNRLIHKTESIERNIGNVNK